MTDTPLSPPSIPDEFAICRQIGLFADAAMSGDRVAFRNLFTEDGLFAIGAPANRRAEGREAIGTLLDTLRKGQNFFVQYAQPGLIEIRGDHATVRTLCHEVATGPSDHFYRNHGMFFDQLVRTGNAWLFAKRHYQYFWLDFSPFAGQSFSQSKAFAAGLAN